MISSSVTLLRPVVMMKFLFMFLLIVLQFTNAR